MLRVHGMSSRCIVTLGSHVFCIVWNFKPVAMKITATGILKRGRGNLTTITLVCFQVLRDGVIWYKCLNEPGNVDTKNLWKGWV